MKIVHQSPNLIGPKVELELLLKVVNNILDLTKG